MATARQILDRREARVLDQLELLRACGVPVVSVTIVTPGADKDDGVARAAAAAASEALGGLLGERGWAERGRLDVDGATGPELLMAVDAPSLDLKRALAGLESAHPLGRLWDLDVVTGPDASGLPLVLGRRALGLPPRRCLVCSADAAGCARSAAHAPVLVAASREALAAGAPLALADEAADRAERALLVEARLTPKPGLVDAESNGAHDDMDLGLLERSAEALWPWLRACWLIGATRPGEVEPLVRLGMAAEADLSRVTGGVNTHRGAFFLHGLLLGAWGAEAMEGLELSGDLSHTAVCPPPVALLPLQWQQSRAAGANRADERVDRLCGRAAAMAGPLLDAWLAADPATLGPRAALCRRLGLAGARGEAASGYATVRTVGLPAYRQRLAETADADDALRWALVSLIAVNPDTNLVARGGVRGLEHARAWAARVVGRRPRPDELVAALRDADADFTARRLSPGGSADLLALTWLLASAEDDSTGARRQGA